MKKTGIRKIALSGGVSMNIKTNMEVAHRCSPEKMFVPGSGSDESLAIGACYILSNKLGVSTKPLNDLYLGTDIEQYKLDKTINNYKSYNFDI